MKQQLLNKYEQFLLLRQCLQNLSTAEASESISMWNRVHVYTEMACYYLYHSQHCMFNRQYCNRSHSLNRSPPVRRRAVLVRLHHLRYPTGDGPLPT